MKNKKLWLTLLVISFVVGIFFRVFGVLNGSHQFAEDEIRVYNYSIEASQGHIPVMGPGSFGNLSSSSIPGGVIFYLLSSFPLLINSSPVSLALFFSILNIIGMFLVLVLLKLLNIKEKTFYLTAILFNISPWTLFLSWGLMHYNIESVFVIILMILTLKIIKNDRNKWLIAPLIFIIAFLPQFHLMIIYLVPFFIIVFIVSRTKISVSYGLIGIITGICIYIPYLITELGNNFANTKGMFPSSSLAPIESLKIISSFVVVSSGEVSAFFKGFNNFMDFLNYSFGFGAIGIVFEVLFLLLVIGAYIYFVKSNISKGIVKDLIKRKNFGSKHFLFLWMFIPMIAFVISLRGFMPRYMIIFYPLTQIIVVQFIVFLWDKVKEKGLLKIFSRVGIILYFMIPLYIAGMMYIYYSKPTDRFDKRYWQAEKIVDYIKKDCDGDSFWIEEKYYGWANSQYRDYVSTRINLRKDEDSQSCYYKLEELIEYAKR